MTVAPRSATAPLWLLAAACSAYFALFAYLTRHFGFFQDEYSYILNRRGWGAGALLDPVNQHLFALPLLAYKLLFVTVGLGTRWPYQLPVFGLHIACVAGLYVLAARRAGRWIALIPAGLLLVLGAGFELELWGIGWSTIGALAACIWSLVALERDDRRGDVWASVLLTIGIATYSIALFFIAAIGIQLAAGRQWRRLPLVGVPLGLYLLWYVGYGQGSVVWANVGHVPSYDVHIAAYGFAGLLGFSSFSFELNTPLAFGYPLLAAAVAALGFILHRRRGLPALTLIGVLGALGFWTATALARGQYAQPDASRYVYPSAVLILLAVIGLLRSRPVSLRAAAVVAAAGALIAVNGLRPLRSYSVERTSTDTVVRAELGAVEIAGSAGDPAFVPDPRHLAYLRLGPYLAAVRAIGSPAFSQQQILGLSSSDRERADATLIGAEGLRARPATVPAARPCSLLAANPAASVLVVRLDPGTSASIAAPTGAPLELRLRRFSASFPTAPQQSLAPGSESLLAVPHDRSPRPWWLEIGAPQAGAEGVTAQVCVSPSV